MSNISKRSNRNKKGLLSMFVSSFNVVSKWKTEYTAEK